MKTNYSGLKLLLIFLFMLHNIEFAFSSNTNDNSGTENKPTSEIPNDYAGSCIFCNGDKVAGGFYTNYKNKLYIITTSHTFSQLIVNNSDSGLSTFKNFTVYLFGINASYKLEIMGDDLAFPSKNNENKFTLFTPYSAKYNIEDNKNKPRSTLDIVAISINQPKNTKLTKTSKSTEPEEKEEKKLSEITSSLYPLPVFIPSKYKMDKSKNPTDYAYSCLLNEFNITTRTDKLDKNSPYSVPEFNILSNKGHVFKYPVIDLSRGGQGWSNISGDKVCLSEGENILGYPTALNECNIEDNISAIGSKYDYIFGFNTKSIPGMSGLPLTISKNNNDEVIGVIQGGFKEYADNISNSWGVPLLPLLATIDFFNIPDNDNINKYVLMDNNSSEYFLAINNIDKNEYLTSNGKKKNFVSLEWGGGVASINDLKSFMNRVSTEARKTRNNSNTRAGELMRSINKIDFNLSDISYEYTSKSMLDKIKVLKGKKRITANNDSSNIIYLSDFINADLYEELKNQPKNNDDFTFANKLTRIEMIQTAWAYLSKENPLISSTIKLNSKEENRSSNNWFNINGKSILSLLKFQKINLINTEGVIFTIYIPYTDRTKKDQLVNIDETSIIFSGNCQIPTSNKDKVIVDKEIIPHAIINFLSVYKGNTPSETLNFFVSYDNEGEKLQLAKEYFNSKIALPSSPGYTWDVSDKNCISCPYIYLPGKSSKYAKMKLKKSNGYESKYCLLAINSLIEKFNSEPKIDVKMGQIQYPGSVLGISGYSKIPSLEDINNINTEENVYKMVNWLEWYFSIILTITANN